MAALLLNPSERGFILLRGDGEKAKGQKCGKWSESVAAKLEKYGVRRAAEDDHFEQKSEGQSAERVAAKQDVLTLLILRNEALCGTVLEAIKRALSWRKSDCHVRVSQVAAKMVAVISEHELVHLNPECGDILKGALWALSGCKIGEHQKDIADLNLLSIAIIQALGPSAPEFLLNVFRSIPGVGHEDANEMMAVIRSNVKRGTPPSTGLKAAVKAFHSKYVIAKSM